MWGVSVTQDSGSVSTRLPGEYRDLDTWGGLVSDEESAAPGAVAGVLLLTSADRQGRSFPPDLSASEAQEIL